MVRTEKWNAAKRNATVAQFRHLLGTNRKEAIQNAMAAGRSLANLMLNGHVTILGIDDVQLERFRRRYGVQESLKAVMFSVATGKLENDMLEQRLDNRFPSHRLVSGKIRLSKRCPLCAKRMCRCLAANAK